LVSLLLIPVTWFKDDFANAKESIMDEMMKDMMKPI
jgi:hypothetical protein